VGGWASEFEWDAANRQHIARHGVREPEAEEAYLDPNAVTLEVSHVAGEPREALIGMTAVGRILVVVVTERAGRVRMVTARRATRSEQQYYHGGG